MCSACLKTVLRCACARTESYDQESDLTDVRPAPIVLAPAPAPPPARVPAQRMRLSQTRNAASSDQAPPTAQQQGAARSMARSADRMLLSRDKAVCESLTCLHFGCLVRCLDAYHLCASLVAHLCETMQGLMHQSIAAALARRLQTPVCKLPHSSSLLLRGYALYCLGCRDSKRKRN